MKTIKPKGKAEKLIKVNSETHRSLKIAAAEYGISIGELLQKMSKDKKCLP